jgi:hypothetical protein
MLTIKEIIKTLNNAFNQKLKKHRGNWEQNDPTADDYIKNRPFYTNGYTTLIKNKTFRTYEDYEWCSPFVFEIVEGEAYKIVWDGKEYECIAFLDQWGYVSIGNINLSISAEDLNDESENTGEPFFYSYVVYGNGNIEYFWCVRNSGTHTVSVYKQNVKKIDKKYMPADNSAAMEMEIDNLYNHIDILNYDISKIPTDVVRYNQTQNLNLKQIQTAQKNLSLNKIDYNKLENLPMSDVIYDNAPFELTLNLGYKFDSFIFEKKNYLMDYVIHFNNSTNSRQQIELVYAGDTITTSLGITHTDGLLYRSEEFTFFISNDNYIVHLQFHAAYSPNKVIGTIYDVKKEKLTQLSDKFIPDTIARISDLPQSDWNINDTLSRQYVNNRTHFVETILGDTIYSFSNGSFVETSIGDIYNIYTTLSTMSNVCWNIGNVKFNAKVRNYTKTNSSGTYTFWYAGNLSLFYLPIEAPDTGEDYLLYTYRLDKNPSNTYFGTYINGEMAPSGSMGTIKYPDVTTVHQLDEKFIPDTISRVSDVVLSPTTASVGQTIVVKSINENGKPTEWGTIDPYTLTDTETGKKYQLSVVNGKLTMTEVD